MTEGSKSLEQKANLNSQKDSAFWKQSGETTKTAKQQVKQKAAQSPLQYCTTIKKRRAQ